ncbi:LysO family transporter [Psychrilyobacter atlanticus]|uniref:LysO family transporter n=1 Tax=Psychrilyobacter atlanticus TaxID=271091 RepID=UPI00042A86F6|nr:LysO family transporter [Psychrilyobacter atlanticus]
MQNILISLILGILIGSIVKFSDKMKKFNGAFQHLGVIILLFAIGITIGINRSLLSNLNKIGGISLVFALLTSLFSIILVFFMSRIIIKRRNN